MNKEIPSSNGSDWTKHVPEMEFPYIQHIYSLYGAADRVVNAHFPNEGHDYGPSKRLAAYPFFIRHLGLDSLRLWAKEAPITESFVKVETDEETNPLRPWAFGGKGAEGMNKEIPSSRHRLTRSGGTTSRSLERIVEPPPTLGLRREGSRRDE